jgi:hypothetical protein
MATDGVAMDEMVEQLGRMEIAIRTYAKRHCIRLRCLPSHWTEAEEDALASWELQCHIESEIPLFENVGHWTLIL